MFLCADAHQACSWYDGSKADSDETEGEHVKIMENNGLSALIVAQPGPLRSGLRALLTVVPRIQSVEQANEVPAILEALEADLPALVLLDAGFSDDGISHIVRSIKAVGDRSRCLVLADDIQQQQEAQAAGADVALIKGVPAVKLFEAIEELLPK